MPVGALFRPPTVLPILRLTRSYNGEAIGM